MLLFDPKQSLVIAMLLAACSQPGPAVTSAELEVALGVLPALLADAASRSGQLQSSLGVLAVESVTWPDGSLGCPEPGRVYPQALVPGYRVRIGGAGMMPMIYHLHAQGSWLYCPAERAVAPLPRTVDPRI